MEIDRAHPALVVIPFLLVLISLGFLGYVIHSHQTAFPWLINLLVALSLLVNAIAFYPHTDARLRKTLRAIAWVYTAFMVGGLAWLFLNPL